MKLSEFDGAISEIYEAATDEQMWPMVFDRICELVSGRGIIVFDWPGLKNDQDLIVRNHSASYQPELVAGYMKRNMEWEKQDQGMFDRQSLHLDAAEIITDSDDRNILKNDETRPNIQSQRKFGLGRRAASFLDKDNTSRFRFTIQYAENYGPIGRTEQAKLELLLPHLAKSLSLGAQISTVSQEKLSLLKVVDQLDIGICLLDSRGRVVLSNQEILRQIDAYGLFKIDRMGKFELHGDANRGRFKHLLEDARNHGQFGAKPGKEAIITYTESEMVTICIEVMPLDSSSEIGSRPFNGSLVISRDTSRPMSVDLELVQSVYGLTEMERSLLSFICDGLTNVDIAERRERSVNTINTQMKSILHKSSAPNRGQLIRLLNNFPA